MQPTTVTVTAVRPFELHSRKYSPGDAVTATPMEVVELARTSLVSLTKRRPARPDYSASAVGRTLQAAADKLSATRTQRLSVEDETVEPVQRSEPQMDLPDGTEDDGSVTIQPPAKGKKKQNTYRRRDLKAEKTTELTPAAETSEPLGDDTQD